MYEPWFYEQMDASSSAGAKAILPLVFHRVGPISSVIDVGCGVGSWLVEAKALGATQILGIDSWTPIDKLQIPPELLRRDNVSLPIRLSSTFDLAICLEVAEHVPESNSMVLVNSLMQMSKNILFSAATPGQGGTGHINEQPHEYWHERFRMVGYQVLDFIRPAIQNLESVPFWYRNNVFLYSI